MWDVNCHLQSMSIKYDKLHVQIIAKSEMAQELSVLPNVNCRYITRAHGKICFIWNIKHGTNHFALVTVELDIIMINNALELGIETKCNELAQQQHSSAIMIELWRYALGISIIA